MGYALRKSIIGVPVLSILMGMLITVIRPSLAESDGLKTGIKFTSRKILQWAVIILGFSLNLGTIAKMGGQSLPVIEADDEEVAQAISVIFLFNVIAAFIFPSFGHAIGLNTNLINLIKKGGKPIVMGFCCWTISCFFDILKML